MALRAFFAMFGAPMSAVAIAATTVRPELPTSSGLVCDNEVAPNNTDLVLLQFQTGLPQQKEEPEHKKRVKADLAKEDADRKASEEADRKADVGFLYPDLTPAMLIQNNLGGLGPDTAEAGIVYLNVGVGGIGDHQFSINMVVTNTSTYIPNSPAHLDRNGLKGGLGVINVKCGEEVNLTFHFVNNKTAENVSLDRLYLTLLDLDTGNPGVREYVEFGPGIVEEYYLSNNTKLDQENTSNGGYRWTANTWTGKDNPDSALNLTATQKEQAVTLRFENVNPIRFLLGATAGSDGTCPVGTGRNMFFGFESNLLCAAKNKTDDIWDDEKCISECNQGACDGNCAQKCTSDCGCTALATPMPTPPQGIIVASASGDPHMVNILGEHFNLWRLGEVEFLKVPRGAAASDMDFSVHALVEDLGETAQRCLQAPYITSMTFRGKWFGDRPVFVDMRDGNLVAFVGDQELQRQRHPLVVGRISESKNVSVVMPIEGHVVIRIGGAKIDVVRDVRPGHFFLNMQARSLSELGDSIGGILGQDDHSDYAKKPDCNKNSVLSLRANDDRLMGSSASASLDF